MSIASSVYTFTMYGRGSVPVLLMLSFSYVDRLLDFVLLRRLVFRFPGRAASDHADSEEVGLLSVGNSKSL
jgi:hypothetical protein